MLALVTNVLFTAKPHIVWIVADDLGYDDTPVMKTGSEILTPVISKLASEGVVLQNYYGWSC
jgi:arylsulfatase A-like enzyme